MAKAPTLPNITGQFASSGQLNQAFRDIEDAFENTISRDGSTPNTMSGDLDLNGNSLLNVDTIDVDNLSIAGLTVTDLASVPEWRGVWAGATAYVQNDLVKINGNVYICLVPHVSGTFSTDLSALRWELFVERGAAGAGTGDMVGANNLSDVSNAATALSNIGGQPLDPFLTDIANLTDPNADRLLFWDDSVGDIGWLTPSTGLSVSGTNITVSGLTLSELSASVVVTESEGITSNDNDTTLPTSAAVKDYVDSKVGSWTYGSSQNTTSGGIFDFTGVPSSASQVVLEFNAVSLSGTDNFLVQLGVSGGPVTSGYAANATLITAGSERRTDGFPVAIGAAAAALTGRIIFDKMDGNSWATQFICNFGTAGATIGSGQVTLSGTLTQVRLTRTGSNTFDSGSARIGWK